MTELKKRLSILKDTFDRLGDWMNKYSYIIAFASKFPYGKVARTDNNRIKGCQSMAWISVDLDENGKINCDVDSDSLIVLGILGLMVNAFNGLLPSEVVDFDCDFLELLGIKDKMVSTRVVGINKAVEVIKTYCRIQLKDD